MENIKDLHEEIDFTHEPCGEERVEVIPHGIVKIKCEKCDFYMLKEFEE